MGDARPPFDHARRHFALLLALLLPFFLLGCSHSTPLRNFQQVDPHVLRGPAPTKQSLTLLRDHYHVRTILDLANTPDERTTATSLGLTYIPLPLHARTLTPSDLQTALTIIASSPTPIYVHCHAGMDRTGAVIAAYRCSTGWTPSAALRELRSHQHPLHTLFLPNLPDTIQTFSKISLTSTGPIRTIPIP